MIYDFESLMSIRELQSRGTSLHSSAHYSEPLRPAVVDQKNYSVKARPGSNIEDY